MIETQMQTKFIYMLAANGAYLWITHSLLGLLTSNSGPSGRWRPIVGMTFPSTLTTSTPLPAKSAKDLLFDAIWTTRQRIYQNRSGMA
ncbi:hypothetical protein CPB86DRAFT_260552 [Serendipita vermifera]|nr:hypothetical protein CPB86DRAFT_260552 [Serendipita vermifera]